MLFELLNPPFSMFLNDHRTKTEKIHKAFVFAFIHSLYEALLIFNQIMNIFIYIHRISTERCKML